MSATGGKIEAPKAQWGVVWGVVSLTREPGEHRKLHKHILVYFEGHRTLLFAPICQCFEFVKQCFMSHFGGQGRGLGGNCPHTPT